MYMNVEAYLRRLRSSLEKVIAPAVDDDKVRGQVFAVSGLLDQLGTRIEIKPEITREDVETNAAMAREACERMAAAGVAPSDELAGLLGELADVEVFDLVAREKSERALSLVIELYFKRKEELAKDQAEEIDRRLREHLTKIATRDIGLAKPPDFAKISRSRPADEDKTGRG